MSAQLTAQEALIRSAVPDVGTQQELLELNALISQIQAEHPNIIGAWGLTQGGWASGGSTSGGWASAGWASGK